LSGVQCLGFYRLGALIEFSVRALEINGTPSPAWLDEIAIAMSLRGKQLGWLLPAPGQSRVEPYPGAAHKTQLYLECDLDPYRLGAVEDARSGADMQVNLAVAALISTPERYRFPSHQTASYLVTQSDWIRVLDEMGYRRSILLEIMVEQAPRRSSPTRQQR
jgi:hypothetical protein